MNGGGQNIRNTLTITVQLKTTTNYGFQNDHKVESTPL